MYIKKLYLPGGVSVPDGEPNAGGIYRLRLIPSAQLSIILPDRYSRFPGLPDMFIDSRAIFLNDDVDFVDVDVLPDYATYFENQLEEANGDYYDIGLQLTIPKDRPEVTAWIHRNRQMKWVALFQDRNGCIRLAGTQDQPLRMTVSSSLGQAGARANNAKVLSLSARTIWPAIYLQSIDSAEIFATTEFDISFSFDFNT